MNFSTRTLIPGTLRAAAATVSRNSRSAVTVREDAPVDCEAREAGHRVDLASAVAAEHAAEVNGRAQHPSVGRPERSGAQAPLVGLEFHQERRHVFECVDTKFRR